MVTISVKIGRDLAGKGKGRVVELRAVSWVGGGGALPKRRARAARCRLGGRRWRLPSLLSPGQ